MRNFAKLLFLATSLALAGCASSTQNVRAYRGDAWVDKLSLENEEAAHIRADVKSKEPYGGADIFHGSRVSLVGEF